MTAMTKALRLAPMLLLLAVAPAVAACEYVSREQVDLAHVLPPPPQPDSETQSRELREVLDLQAKRTPQQAERAVGDNKSAVKRFADAVGIDIGKKKLPRTAAFLKGVTSNASAVIPKDAWNRQRPFVVSTDVHPIGKTPKSASYPSAHATRGYLVALVLAEMLPEKRDALLARGREYGENRIIAGDHFRSDVEAGRRAAEAIEKAMLQSSSFRHDLANAKSELRPALGLAN
jgi:acid phosphatase (class A)